MRGGEALVDLVPRTAGHARALLPMILGTPVVDTLVWDGPVSEEEFLATYASFGDEPHHRHFTILEGATGLPAGTLGIRPGLQRGRGDIGYWVGIPFQGRGLGTAAVARALEIAFGEMGMEKVEAGAFVGNHASLRILEKNGFQREGLIRKAVLKRGRWVDEHLLGVTREEWEAGRPPA